MAHWQIPHDETHRFLDWGERDEILMAWETFFRSKGVPFEVGGGRDSWTIYKHIGHTNIDSLSMSPCCVEEV